MPPRAGKPGSVGLAAGPDAAIMDDAGKLLAGGAIGEVVIRGYQRHRRTGQQPEANARAFNAGWFRTGDQGRNDAEGISASPAS